MRAVVLTLKMVVRSAKVSRWLVWMMTGLSRSYSEKQRLSNNPLWQWWGLWHTGTHTSCRLTLSADCLQWRNERRADTHLDIPDTSSCSPSEPNVWKQNTDYLNTYSYDCTRLYYSCCADQGGVVGGMCLLELLDMSRHYWCEEKPSLGHVAMMAVSK